MSTDRASRWSEKYFLIAPVVLIPVIILIACLHEPAPATPPPPKGWDKVEPKLSQFDQAATKAAGKRVERVQQFFGERESGADVFAKEVVSWGGKWELLKDAVGCGDHRRYLAETYSRHLFSTAEVKAVMNDAVTGYMSDLDGMENDLLVQLRADLADSELGRGALRKHLETDEAFRREYWRLTAILLPQLVKELQISVSREVLALILMDLGTQLTMEIGAGVAMQLGLDATLLTTGAAGTVTTLGVSLIVCYVVDLVLDWVLKELGHDPEAEIARLVRGSVRELRDRLIKGEAPAHKVYGKLQQLTRTDEDASVRDACRKAADRIERGGRLGLRWQLQRIQEVRALLRREALRKFLLEGGQP